jgi:hypothetical protein
MNMHLDALLFVFFWLWPSIMVTAFLAGGPVLIRVHVAFACEDLEEDALTMRRCWRRMMKRICLNMQKIGTDPGQVLNNLIIKN